MELGVRRTFLSEKGGVSGATTSTMAIFQIADDDDGDDDGRHFETWRKRTRT